MQLVSKELRCEKVAVGDEGAIEKIINLEALFPVKLQYGRKRIASLLADPENIHFFLKRGEDVGGYLLAIPQNDIVEELMRDDPLMRPDDSCYYIDHIAVAPEERKGLSFLLLVDALIEELKSRGICKVSSHILATDKLHLLIARKFRKTLLERRPVTLAMHGNAPFEYMESTCVP